MITARNTDIGALIGIGQQREGALPHRGDGQAARLRRTSRRSIRARRVPASRRDIELQELPGQHFHRHARADGAVDRSDELAHAARRDRSRQSRAASCCPARSRKCTSSCRPTPATFRLPVNTLIFRSEGLRVAVVKNGRVALVPVTLGRDFGSTVEVVAGLTGDEPIDRQPAGLADRRARSCRVRGRCPGARQPAVKRPALMPDRAGAAAALRQTTRLVHRRRHRLRSRRRSRRTPTGRRRSPPIRPPRGAWWEVFQDDPQLERARGAHRRLERDAEGAAGAVPPGARRDRDQPRRALSAGHDGAADHATGTQSGNRTNATAHVSDLGLPAAGRRVVRGRRLGPRPQHGGGQRARARRRAPPTSKRCACRCTPSSRSTTSSCAASTPSKRSSTTAVDGVPARARAHAQPVQRRHRLAGGRRAGRDAAREHARAGQWTSTAQRAALEHAIAVLVGKPPSSLSARGRAARRAAAGDSGRAAVDLLERRPDIAAAERRVAAASAEVGVANAAFFPRLLLTASAGFESRSLASWLAGLSTFWSAGPAAVATIFDGGRRRAVSAQAQAAYDEIGRRLPEAILRPLCRKSKTTSRRCACCARRPTSRRARSRRRNGRVTLATNRYRGGVASYLEVIAAQNAALSNQRDAAVDPVAPARRERAAHQGARRRMERRVASRAEGRRTIVRRLLRASPVVLLLRGCAAAPARRSRTETDRRVARREGSVHARSRRSRRCPRTSAPRFRRSRTSRSIRPTACRRGADGRFRADRRSRCRRRPASVGRCAASARCPSR